MFEFRMQFIIEPQDFKVSLKKYSAVERSVYSAVSHVSCYITCFKCSRYFVLSCCNKKNKNFI